MEQIILKKILTDSPITYGPDIPFSFSIPTSNPTHNRGNSNMANYYYSSMIDGTDLRTLNASVGDKFQAFYQNGEKMGFILRYQGNVYDKPAWMMYNEETACFSLQTTENDVATYLCLNKKYLTNAETLDDVLNNAEILYNQRFEPFTVGMDSPLYELIQLGHYDTPSTDKCYISAFDDYKNILCNVKMRPFSSWYKLITGKFYKQETLFAMETATGEKFYFGRVISKTQKNGCVDPAKATLTEQLENDPSYGFSDVIYGTDIGYMAGVQWGSTVNFENGLRIGFEDPQWNNGNDPQWAYGSLKKLSATGDVELKQRIQALSGFNNGAYDVTGFDKWYPSVLSATLSITNGYGGRSASYDANPQAVDIFISPEYNNFSYSDFVEELEKLTYTEAEWKQLLQRVFTFATTTTSKSTTTARLAYGYEEYGTSGNPVMSFIFSGWANFGENTTWCTTYYSGDANVRNDFSSGTAWGEVISFVNPMPDPGPGPGPGPEPEKETDEITIGTLAELAIKNGVPFLGYEDKLQPFTFMQEYLGDFELFDEDIKETRGFLYPLTVKETKDATLEHFRKRAGFVIKKHAKELEGLWKIAATTFDPAYNVEEHIVEELKKTGSDTLRDAIDAVNQTDSLGARKNTSLYGEQTSTQNTGAQTSSVEYGARQSTSQEGKAGFNSSDYQKNVSTNQTENAHTDSTNNGAREDSSTFSAHTDEMTSDAVVDTHKTDFREDVHEQTYNNTVSRKYDRQGNVGTMSTPELLQKAADSVAVFDFYDKLYDMVLRELAWYSESGYDVMF